MLEKANCKESFKKNCVHKKRLPTVRGPRSSIYDIEITFSDIETKPEVNRSQGKQLLFKGKASPSQNACVELLECVPACSNLSACLSVFVHASGYACLPECLSGCLPT